MEPNTTSQPPQHLESALPTGPIDSTSPPPSPSQTPFFNPPDRQTFSKPPRILIIGAGSRGTAYAQAALATSNAIIAAIAEPIAYKRKKFGRRFIWDREGVEVGQEFAGWREWVVYEKDRRVRQGKGEVVEEGIDAVFVCVLDEMHEEVVCGIAGLGIHICCEKPLATSLEACVNIYGALKAQGIGGGGAEDEDQGGVIVKKKETVFGICHVLRYSPHNMLLRHLVLEKEVIGEVLSLEHVEPVGWWHFSHSYVRGNWRKESTTAPSLLTKSCHDIDFILWMLCSPPQNNQTTTPHLPSSLTSTGTLSFFKNSRKPPAAGDATNCLSCPHEKDCNYSAKKIYLDRHLKAGNTGWPVKIVNPEIEECYNSKGIEEASNMLLGSLKEDWDEKMTVGEVESRPWFGRCVWEADNDVCDDQCVTMTWDEETQQNGHGKQRVVKGRGAKTAQFHMVAFTEQICQRRGRIYGTKGEIEYDSERIRVHDFETGITRVHEPRQEGGGHGGGDAGLVRQFLRAVDAVDGGGMGAAEAQREFLGCDLEEAFRSHAAVFAAEDARKERRVVDWKVWWEEEVEKRLHGR